MKKNIICFVIIFVSYIGIWFIPFKSSYFGENFSNEYLWDGSGHYRYTHLGDPIIFTALTVGGVIIGYINCLIFRFLKNSKLSYIAIISGFILTISKLGINLFNLTPMEVAITGWQDDNQKMSAFGLMYYSQQIFYLLIVLVSFAIFRRLFKKISKKPVKGSS